MEAGASLHGRLETGVLKRDTQDFFENEQYKIKDNPMKQLICVGIKTGNQLTLRFQRPAAVTLNLAAQSTQSSIPTKGYHSIGAILSDMVDVETRS